MSFNMITNTVHCKVSYNGQIRRFALDCTAFSSLKETIARLLSLPDEFVLKYLDDESDYVTLESKEDLRTALALSPKLLRILVDKKDAPSTISDDCLSKKYRKRHQNYHERKDHHGQHGHGHHGHGHQGQRGRGHHGHGGHGHHGHKGYDHAKHPEKTNEERNLRKEKKMAFINQCLADLGSDDSQLTPRALIKKQKLLRKKQRIEAYQRGECYHQKKRQGLLTPEEEQKNRSLKVQIQSVKMDLAKLKARQREIKMMLQDKVGDKPLIDELAALKEQKNILYTQKRALFDQMHI